MCGIAGVIRLEDKHEFLNELDSTDIVSHLTHSMEHRGPDSVGFYMVENVILAMTRLAIVGGNDGQQPIWNEDETICVICNGEIYNHRVLRQQLETLGHAFATQSDVEVIVHLYESLHEDCVAELEGDFAFALWDSIHEKVLIARDRCGVKPLYYTENQGSFVFSSEFKALLALHDSNKLCDDALAAYHALRFCPHDQTIVEDVKKVLPGQCILIQNGEVLKRFYWSASARQPRPARFTKAEKKLVVRETLYDAVKSQGTGEVKTGILLSGGLDSTALLALYKKAFADVPDTYTVEFEQPDKFAQVTEYRETVHARRVADQYGSRHISGCYSATQVLEQLPEMVAALDEPIADPTAIPLWFAVQLARQNGVKVLYSGEGLDEIFNGYDVYRQTQWIKALNYFPKSVRRIAIDLLKSIGAPGAGVLERSLNPIETWYQSVGGVFSEDELSKLFSHSLPQRLSKVLGNDSDRNSSILNQMTHIDLSTWLPEDTLVKSDKISMHHSVEMRVPFLSRTLVELALSMDDRDKLRGKTGKWIVRRALDGIVPDWVLRRKKAGFPVPLTAWLFGPWKEYALTTLTNSNAFTRPLYNAGYIRELFRAPDSHKPRAARLIWTLLCLELWIDSVYSRSAMLKPHVADKELVVHRI